MNNEPKNGIKIILTGATGMVGEGVLQECLQHPMISSVLVINRNPCGYIHPKLKEIIYAGFYDLSSIENELRGYDACFFCLGVSSVGKNEADYTKVTYTLTMVMAKTLILLNREMTFCYVSGTGTDSSEKSRMMWARVKGRTENDLMKLAFKQVFAFRPGYIQPTPGLKHTHQLYKYISWIYPVVKAVFPDSVTSLRQVGLAMINACLYGYEKRILSAEDINTLAAKDYSSPGHGV